MNPIGDLTGSIFVDNNKNCNVQGEHYYGRIVGNSNSNVRCDKTSVELFNNRNIDVNLINSTVKAVEQSNCKLSASSSILELKSNKNIDVNAEDAWCKFEDNSNINFKGKGSKEFLSKFVGNRNSNFSGTNNKLSAFNNRNLLIGGNDNCLEISKTHNHNVRPAPFGSNR